MHSTCPTVTEMEILVSKIEKVLSAYSHAPIIENEIKQKIQMLEIWMNIYKHGLNAANKLSDKGTQWLAELSVKLKLPQEMPQLPTDYHYKTQNQVAAIVEQFNKAATDVRQVRGALDTLLPKSTTIH